MTLERFVKYENAQDDVRGCRPEIVYNYYWCTVDKVNVPPY